MPGGNRLNSILKRLTRPGAHWEMLAVTGVLFVLVAVFVDLKPVVEENFFFSTSDPGFGQSKKIEQRFPSQPEVILNVSSRDISSPRYLAGIQKLTQQINTIDEVSAVKSLAEGPKSFQDALASPFWSRLLIAEDRKSSNVLVFLENKDPEKPIKRIERIMHEFDETDFRIHIAGPPYVVEMIRRSLAHDFGYFSLTAVVLFGLTMAAMFRSGRVFLGMLATCTSAVLLTLLLQSVLGKKIGILTVNLGTIVFVVAMSHLVYMTFNWQTLADRRHRLGKESPDLGTDALRMTFPPSFWSMICASLGFASLLIVEAKPLRELGFGGVLGSVVAFACAYVMYPPFLRWAVPRKSKIVEAEPPKRFWARPFPILSAAVILVSAVLGFGLRKVNTDPSLLDYFKPHQELRDGLEYVDRSGGCNPLTLVVSATDGSKLNTDDAYQKMWTLHGALENYKDVGTVVSLPTLLAEGDRTPFSFLISYEKMMEIMAQPKYARVAKSFVTEDRTQAVFLLRMVEARRDKLRLEVVDDLRSITRKHGFTTSLVGGIYYLQGRLAKLVASSLVTGLFWLNLLFVVIALVVARSVRGALAMIVSLTLMPLCMLGGIGWFNIPVDIISAPATNVCIGIAIDSMIHLVFGVRRAERDGKKGWSAWVAGREEQWRGIVYSDVIIAAGFAIFVLSNFPPTQRFGLVVLAGLIVDILANLFVLPLLGGSQLKKK
ncbi:MAG TPA: MMPL family transporter [Chthoniobacterales bacterium]|nr:MMPL family transporter [Chthoniobacterales bacterium]